VPRSWSETHTQFWGKLCESLPFQRPPCSVTEDNAFRVAIQYAYWLGPNKWPRLPENAEAEARKRELRRDLPRLPPVIFLREHGRNLRSVDSKVDSKSTTASFPASRSALPGSVVYVSTAQADSGSVT
jgi:hypothetical protein